MDKAGNFIGWLHIEGVNLSVALVEQALSKVHFTAERSNYYKSLVAAEEAAKQKKEKVHTGLGACRALSGGSEALLLTPTSLKLPSLDFLGGGALPRKPQPPPRFPATAEVPCCALASLLPGAHPDARAKVCTNQRVPTPPPWLPPLLGLRAAIGRGQVLSTSLHIPTLTDRRARSVLETPERSEVRVRAEGGAQASMRLS